MKKNKMKMPWLTDKALQVLEADDEWLHAGAIAERISSRFPDPSFFWTSKSVTSALRILHAQEKVVRKQISGKVHYRLA